MRLAQTGSRIGVFAAVLLLFAANTFAQVDAIAKRPYYELTASLFPRQHRASGTLLLKYVNQTGEDLNDLAFAMDNPEGRINRVRVNRRSAEVIYKSTANGDPYTGFELKSRRSLPPDVVSEIEIGFESQAAYDSAGLVIYQGDWFPRILGPGFAPDDPADRAVMDVDATVDYPVEWRGALSGLVLREDARGDRVELLNAAAGIKNYGVAMARDLHVLDEHLYGILLRTFHRLDDDNWGQHVQRQAAEVVEYFKRRTPITPPLVLNIVPGDSTLDHARILFANTIEVPAREYPSSIDLRRDITKAVTELYWGFGSAMGPGVEMNPLENALSLYGVLMWSRTTGQDSAWIEPWRSRLNAGLLADHGPMLEAPLIAEGEDAPPFLTEAATANRFLALLMLDRNLGSEAMEKVWDTAVVEFSHQRMDEPALVDAMSQAGVDTSRDIVRRLVHGVPFMDARVAGVENRGLIASAYVTEVTVQKKGEEVPVPVGVLQADGTWEVEILGSGMNSLVLRTPSPPVRVAVDPMRTLPLLVSAEHDPGAVARVADALGSEGRWAEARSMLELVVAQGLEPDGACVHALAEARLHTGDFASARELLLSATQDSSDSPWQGQNMLLLGKAYDLLGQRAEAIETYRKAANHDGIHDQAMKYIQTPYTQSEQG